MAVPAVRLPVLITWSEPQRAKVHPAGETAGVPATNRLEPLSSPTVAPATASGATPVNTGAAGLLKFTFVTLAAIPPHSGPQFKMKAVVSLVSLGSKTAV